jgi:hypothetical protein
MSDKQTIIVSVPRRDADGRNLDVHEAAAMVGLRAKYRGSKLDYYYFEVPCNGSGGAA